MRWSMLTSPPASTRAQRTSHAIHLDQIPAFQDGELMLFECWAISRHVFRKYKTDKVNLLREGNLHESALVDVWLDVEAHQYSLAI
ncbi:hypothetical protein PR202_ga22857 [Eleusine coracana subsp. coracana]|uniref:glutathione transferase n=1 Tax=Eleusine coracana subsp. coracana TaxID=191504 RepID=A0AAV5D3P8_ELECO|nr:hypothetical protein PR202_ga22857 [Eleusine coracana subsp. coracana]